MSRRLAASLASLTVLFALVAGGCSTKEKVGTGVDVNVKGAYNLLGTTTTVNPTATTQPLGHLGIGAASTTVLALRPVTTAAPTTTPKPVIALDIAIHGDTGTNTTQFDPSAARVYVGTIVQWTNRDVVPRSVVADNGAFSSPMLAPGATFQFKPTTVGSINYHDGTRPYAVATLDVISR